MTTKSEPYFWVECDGCGVISTEGGDYAAWAQVDAAREEADAIGWSVGVSVTEIHNSTEVTRLADFCPGCTADKVCPECEQPYTEDNPRVSDEGCTRCFTTEGKHS